MNVQSASVLKMPFLRENSTGFGSALVFVVYISGAIYLGTFFLNHKYQDTGTLIIRYDFEKLVQPENR